MDDLYYYKYMKYKIKYLDQKKQIGGNIHNFVKLFNDSFLDNWILTGSEAIKLYLTHFKRLDLLTFIPNDIDIIYVANNLADRKIGNFMRVQSSPQRSMTFRYEDLSFDISTQPTSNYYVIDGIKVIPPDELITIYNDNRLSTDSVERKKTIDEKIIALSEIKRLMLGIPKLRLSIIKKKPFSALTLIENKGKKMRPLLFTNSDDE